MGVFGIRDRVKTGIKKVLGVESVGDSSPPSWQNRTPKEMARPRPVEVAPLVEEGSPAPSIAVAVPEPPPVEEVAAAAPAEAPAHAPGEATPDDVVGPPIAYQAVQEILDDMVRPALQGDGGDITLIKVEDNNIYVKLVGSCSTCPSSIMTMKMGVEALLKEEFPAMRELVQVE